MSSNGRLSLAALVLLVSVQCTSFRSSQPSARAAGWSPERSPSAETQFLKRLDSWDQFMTLAHATETGLGTERELKLVYNLKTDELFFINLNLYPVHLDFVKAHIGWNKSDFDFTFNYAGDGSGREFNLATLTLSPRKSPSGKPEMLLSIWNGDPLAGQHLKRLFAKVRAQMSQAQFDLIFHPISDVHLINVKVAGLPYVESQELFKGRLYWPLSRATAVGYVKVLSDVSEAALNSLEPSHIAVFLNGIPNDIGFVAGIVSQSFQTAMSHINVKSKNRGTANMSWTLAGKRLGPLDGKFIQIEMGSEEPTITDLSHLPKDQQAKMIADFWSSKRPVLKEQLQEIKSHPVKDNYVDLRAAFSKLPSRKEYGALVGVVGAKATNLGLLNFLRADLKERFAVQVPEAVALRSFFTTSSCGNLCS